MRNKKNRLLLCILLVTFLSACGSRGDPNPPEPYKEVGAPTDLRASRRDDGIYLTWRMPKDFPRKAIKGFLVLRAEVPHEADDLRYVSIDFVTAEKDKVFEYIDKDITKDKTYAYKIVTVDKKERMGRDSNIALVRGEKQEIKKIEVYLPTAPTGLIAVYTLRGIILTWDEVPDVRLYRVYRSIARERDFVLIGEVVTPAFTDRDVEPSKRYYYIVSAVRESEGPSSRMIEVITESH